MGSLGSQQSVNRLLGGRSLHVCRDLQHVRCQSDPLVFGESSSVPQVQIEEIVTHATGMMIQAIAQQVPVPARRIDYAIQPREETWQGVITEKLATETSV